MTGPEPAAPTHLDLDALADALAGEPHEHLAGCVDCTSRLAELEAAEAGVVAALGALPDPPLPDGLAERLTAALAAEPPLTAPVAAPRTNVTALPERAPRRRLLPAAAAAVLLLSAGGLGYGLLQGGGATEGADTAALDAGGGTTGLLLNASGTDYADTTAVVQALPGVLAGSAPVVLDSSGTTAAKAEPEQDGAAAMTMSSSADARSGTEAQAPVAASVDPLARLRTQEGLADCLRGVLPPEEPDLQPRALDYAQYQGSPALAVVLPDPDPAKLSVFVVGPGCTAADAAVLGFFRVAAP